jgi:hypothetical protein
MKAKPVFIVIITLVIGFIIGMLTSAQIRYHKLKPVKIFFSEERFRDGFYQAIQPDEKQKVVIDEILDKYASINSDLQYKFRRQLETNMKDFRKELDSNLTKEQITRLKEMDERREQIIKHNRRMHDNDSTGRRSDKRYFQYDRQKPGNDSIRSVNSKEQIVE